MAEPYEVKESADTLVEFQEGEGNAAESVSTDKEILAKEKNQEQILRIKEEINRRKDKDVTSFNAVDLLDSVITGRELTAKDVELLIDKIIVDQDGSFEIRLRYGIASLVDEREVIKRLANEKNIFRDVLIIILGEENVRGYTSAKSMNRQLREMGWAVSVKSVIPFFVQLSDMGIIERTDNKLKPYKIIASADHIRECIEESQQ